MEDISDCPKGLRSKLEAEKGQVWSWGGSSHVSQQGLDGVRNTCVLLDTLSNSAQDCLLRIARLVK